MARVFSQLRQLLGNLDCAVLKKRKMELSVGKRGAGTPQHGAKRANTLVPDIPMSGAGSSAAPGEASAKKSEGAARAKEEALDKAGFKRLKSMFITLATLTLSMARELAIVKSIVIHVILFQIESSDLQVIVKDATFAYSKTLKAMTAVEKAAACSPHLVAWNRMLTKYKDRQEVMAHIEDIKKGQTQKCQLPTSWR